MEHSPKFKQVRDFYKRHLWTEAMTRNAVVKGWITAEEFQEIVGKPYQE